MPIIAHLAPRLSHKYVDNFSHLDNWGDALRFKFLAPRLIEEGNGYDEGATVRQRIIGSKHADQALQMQTLLDNLRRSGCAHEYDCCGCPITRATIRPVRPVCSPH